MTTARVRAVQERRRSGAAGPHRTRPEQDEPCLCATAYVCRADTHDDHTDEEN